jgi:hypothetical protein
MVGLSPRQGLALGWEGGAGAGLLNATLGAELRPFGDRVAEFYALGEPSITLPIQDLDSSTHYPDRYLSIGASAGFAVDEHGSAMPLTGGWIGVPWVRAGDCRDRWVPTASISIGVHVFIDSDAADWTLYAAPKFGTIGNCPDSRVDVPKI